MLRLTPAERLITYMLAEVMEHLEINQEIDPSFIKSQLAGGDEWAIVWKHQIFGNTENVSEEVVDETASILSMMSFIEYSYNKLPPEEQAEFADEHRREFRGFDGNHDRHYGVAQTFIDELDRWSEFKGRYLNSHGSITARGYLLMKPAYDAEMRGGMGEPLSAEQLRRIFSSRSY